MVANPEQKLITVDFYTVTQKDLSALSKINLEQLLVFLNEHHPEHPFQNLAEMEADLQGTLSQNGSIIFGLTESGRISGFVQCLPILHKNKNYLYVYDLTNTENLLTGLAQIGREIIKAHPQATHILTDINPQGSQHDQRLFRFYYHFFHLQSEADILSHKHPGIVFHSFPIENLQKLVL